MSTSGSITFVIDGTEKTAYNHHDSYPQGLGDTVLDWLRDAVEDMDALRQAVRDLRVVSPDSTPTAADTQHLSQHEELKVPEYCTPECWHDLLGKTQGHPDLILLAGIVEDASDFPVTSRYCEWGYVIDFDTKVFEVYQGHQDEPHDKGRFAAQANTKGTGRYPIALVTSWPLNDLPSDDEFLAKSHS